MGVLRSYYSKPQNASSNGRRGWSIKVTVGQDKSDWASGAGHQARVPHGDRGRSGAAGAPRPGEHGPPQALSDLVPSSAKSRDAVRTIELVRPEAEAARQEAEVQQLCEAVQRRQAVSEQGASRGLAIKRTCGLLDRVVSAYRA